MDAVSAVTAIPAGDAIDIIAGIIIVLPGFLGMYAHWRVAKRKGQAQGTFLDYLIADNPAGTGITLTMFFSSMAAMNWAGLFDQVSAEYIVEAAKNFQFYKPAMGAMIMSGVTGYTCDSRFNSSVNKQ